MSYKIFKNDQLFIYNLTNHYDANLKNNIVKITK